MPLLILCYMASTNDLSCLDGVIGLARCACPCLEATAPEGFDEATSGLYITDLVPLNMAEAGPDCENPTNPWNVLIRGRTLGASMFLNDFRSGLGKQATARRERYRGQIGEVKARATIPLTKAYAGVHIPSAFIRGGYMRITSVGGVFDQDGTITARVYDQHNNTHGSPIVINTVGSPSGTNVEVAVDINLPLWLPSGELAQYWVAYEVHPDNLPRAIRVWCPTCGGSSLPAYSTSNPYWQTPNTRYSWTKWIMVGAWQGNSLTEFDLEADNNVSSSTGYTNGLTLTIELSCDPANVICLDGFDYSDPATMAAAYAAHYAMAICVGEQVMMNIEPFRESGVTNEILAVALPAWRTRYEENLAYAQFNADLTATDCVFCKPAFSLSVQGKKP